MRPLSIKTLAPLKNNNKNKIKKKTSKKKKTAMPKCFVAVGFLFTIKLFRVVAFSSSSMLCLACMFLIPFEARFLASLLSKQSITGKRCFSLADDMLVSLLSKQSVVDKDCFSLADDSFALPPPKQCAAGNKWSCLVDKSLISPLSKQSVVDKDYFSLATHLLASPPPIVL